MSEKPLNRWKTWELICSLGTNPHPGLPHPLDKKIVALYQGGMTITEVAAEIGEPPRTVQKKLHEYGVIRTCYEKRILRSGVDTDEVIRRYTAGESMNTISRSMNISIDVVRVRLAKGNIKIRSGYFPKRDLDEEEIIKRYQAGESMGEIAHDMRCDLKTVKRRLIDNGISIRTREEDGKILSEKRQQKKDSDKEILKLYAQGMSVKTIGEQLGHARNYISKRVKIYGANRNHAEINAMRMLELDEGEIVRRYKAGESRTAIARSLGVSEKTVIRRLLKNEVAIRSLSEAQYMRRSRERKEKGR